MEVLNYTELSQEIEDILKKTQVIILATCADSKVTARAMAPINNGLTILFATNKNSEKVKQMEQNKSIALAIGNLKIEAVVELFGHPKGHSFFTHDYLQKFPQYGEQYPEKPDDLLVIANPLKISLFKFLGKPCEDVLIPVDKRAYRIDLS